MIDDLTLQFVSLNKEWITCIKELAGTNAMTRHCNIKMVSQQKSFFVSPANCLGIMDGGIDEVLSRTMFPGCEKAVREKIAGLGFQTALGRKYLPIGSAVVVPVAAGAETALISAPTMFLPRDVSDTENAYWSTVAALAVACKYKAATGVDYRRIVFTGHCCGHGNMAPAESARQMWTAVEDFKAGRTAAETDDRGPDVYLGSSLT